LSVIVVPDRDWERPVKKQFSRSDTVVWEAVQYSCFAQTNLSLPVVAARPDLHIRFEEDVIVIVGVPRESYPGERRVGLVPMVVPTLAKAGFEVVIETGAGVEAGYRDAHYVEKGAKILPDRAAVFSAADIVVQVLCYGSNDATGAADLPLLRRDQVLIGFLRPLGSLEVIQQIAATGATSFAIELIPRTTRAQSMDALSSMGTVCGYKAVLIAAETLPRFFPMLTTAAGTITPARVFVIGAGVAGLQAISTARRLGAVAMAYDLRPAAKEQVQSLGGRFVELPIEAKDAQDARGYGTQQDESFYRRQRELLGRVVAESDVVIAAAVIPGKKPPVLVTEEMVKGMAPGSVIVDLAAEARGKLRTDPRRRNRDRPRRHHHRANQCLYGCSLPCQPDVRAQYHRISAAPGEGLARCGLICRTKSFVKPC
jgi:NAD(P) transhydrogenase subunit alpha